MTRALEDVLAGVGLANILVALPVASILRADDGTAVTAVIGVHARVLVPAAVTVLALVLGAAVAVTRRRASVPAQRVWFVGLGLMACLVALRAVRSQFGVGPPGPAAIRYALVGLLAVGLVWLLGRLDMRVGLRTMAFTSPLVLIQVWQILTVLSPAEATFRPRVPYEARPRPADVHVIVLDELALKLILDGERVDRRVVPNLAAFADGATWYRHAATNFDITNYAIPTLLTGRPSGPEAGEGHLFDRLAPLYRVQIVSDWHHYCAAFSGRYDRCVETARDAPVLTWRALARLYLLRLSLGAVVDRVAPRLNADLWEVSRTTLRLFSGMAPAAGDPPTFNYLHSFVTHQPWAIQADGSLGLSSDTLVPLEELDRHALARALERYRGTAAYADRELGGYFEALRRAGRLDSALVVITADHGISFDPAAPGRMHGAANDWIVRVPLIIKFPGQRSGRVEDAPVSHLDVLPTILAALDLPPASTAAGVALGGEVPARRPVPFTSVQPRPWKGTNDVVHYSVDVSRGEYATR